MGEDSELGRSADLEGAIFEVALSMDDAEARRHFIERLFPNDPDGLRDMEALVASASEATSFFLEARQERLNLAAELLEDMPSSPETKEAEDELSSQDLVGRYVENYRLVRCLGEGSSGIVYEARQEKPVSRKVAIKIIHAGMDTKSVIARFNIERQALAMMDHPNIAKVIDVGSFYNGRPYFVMELVKGEPITAYCDRVGLTVANRIRLFIQVCHAIQHAHHKGVIHRDLKPSNIMVSDQGAGAVVKVIDFGIAKAMDPNFKRYPGLTAHDQFIGTPAYMSPEQVDMVGIDVDTRSDVYSLGVVLYELLTSHTPFDGKTLVDSGVSQMRLTLLNDKRTIPSQKLLSTAGDELTEIARVRSVDAPKLISQIHGDLDWIVMKAVEKDRNRRYETVNGLAMDLERFLTNRPVLARRPGNIYTFRKFVRRNRVPFFSSAVAAMSLVIGFGTATHLYLRERTALAEQERLGREAEAARDVELNLRRQAQARANVSRVALLLNEGQVEEADRLLQKNPLLSIEPSMEASSVFRSLGNWYATYDRWSEANQCFRLLAQATRLSEPGQIMRGSDLLITAPALLESGDEKSYEAFRSQILGRFLPVSDSLQAQHILKASLLRPVGPEVIRELEDAASLCRESIMGNAPSSYPAWEAFSLTLYHYRAGDFHSVMKVSEIGLASPEIKEICAACIRCLTAVAQAQLGNPIQAKADLEWARAVIETPDEISPDGARLVRPRWYDWSVGSLLLEEAENRIAAR